LKADDSVPVGSHWNEAGHKAVTQTLLPEFLEIWKMEQ